MSFLPLITLISYCSIYQIITSQLQIYPLFPSLKIELGPLNICTLLADTILILFSKGVHKNSGGKIGI